MINKYMDKKKIEHKCECDYESIEIIWNNEDSLTEEVKCNKCGAKGFRDFVFSSEEWYQA